MKRTTSRFKPCYKWNTFNTTNTGLFRLSDISLVLNLVISGIPSILTETIKEFDNTLASFKPCYKWNTFNTYLEDGTVLETGKVLNLVISGIPSIHFKEMVKRRVPIVLNLVISGIPSIRGLLQCLVLRCFGFKPCYKWNTFNTVLSYLLNKSKNLF